ncbi:hypothetical protein EDD15DRAFT_2308999 [Pisolithus albus]|nr:hypothetical protein EDD15DRAFT_2308999 [Pisolithus albus]
MISTYSRCVSHCCVRTGIPSSRRFFAVRSRGRLHTGIRIVQSIVTMMGCVVLSHLRGLVGCIAHELTDEE